MTKASRQDVEMLQKLVVEFHDELEALGVRVDEMEGKVNKLDERLGGWKISGRLRLDVVNEDNDAPTSDTKIVGENFRIFFERFFGEDEQFHFLARVDSKGNAQDGNWAKASNIDDPMRWSLFYVEMPFFFDSRLTVGKFDWDFEGDYRLGGTFALPTIGEHSWSSALTDQRLTGFAIEKQFGLGSFRAYLTHPDAPFGADANTRTRLVDDAGDTVLYSKNYSAWELVMAGKFQFNEQFGFDLGGQLFVGDNAEPANPVAGDLTFDKLWTIWAGLRFDFNDTMGFNGIFYHQQKNGDAFDGLDWVDADYDNAKLWKIAFAVKQEALKFTSLWLEYGQADAGFWLRDDHLTAEAGLTGNLPADLKFWKIALGQVWNEAWSTHLFYTGYDFDVAAGTDSLKAEWGLGVMYTMNSNVKFDLSYTNLKMDIGDDDHVLRLRTQVTF
jgi:hypothetical protein